VARACARHNINPQGDKAVGVVRLSGLIHLEDRVAFSEAARQLCRCVRVWRPVRLPGSSSGRVHVRHAATLPSHPCGCDLGWWWRWSWRF